MDSPDAKGRWHPSVPYWKRLRWSAPFYVVGIVGAALLAAPFLSTYVVETAFAQALVMAVGFGAFGLLFWLGHKIKVWLYGGAKPAASSEADSAIVRFDGP